MTSWKRRWLNSPVSSSVTAWRCTVSCRSTFSTRDRGLAGQVGEQLALGVAEAAVAAGDGDDRQHAVAALGGAQRRGERATRRRSGSPRPRRRPSPPPRRRAARAGRPRARRCGRPPPSARRRVGASSRARTRRRRRRPRSARRSRARRRGRGRGRTTRRRAGSPPAGARARVCSSSSRASSSRAIELNSLPSAANSSLPSVGHRDAEVAAAEPLRGVEQPLRPRLQRARDDHREDEGEQQEAERERDHGDRARR